MAAKKPVRGTAAEPIREEGGQVPLVAMAPDGLGTATSDTDVYRLVGERILMFRHRAQLSQLILAERVGVTRTSITNLEKGKQRPPLALLLRIASALGLADYRRLLPTPEELAVAVLGPAEGMAMDHPFWVHVRQLLRRTFSSPTERITIVQSTFDVVELVVDDTNPLRPESAMVVVRPRPRPVTGHDVAQLASRMADAGVDRGILITSGSFEPDAVTRAQEHAITLINGVGVTHLQRMLNAALGARQAEDAAAQTPFESDALGEGAAPGPLPSFSPDPAPDPDPIPAPAPAPAPAMPLPTAPSASRRSLTTGRTPW